MGHEHFQVDEGASHMCCMVHTAERLDPIQHPAPFAAWADVNNFRPAPAFLT